MGLDIELSTVATYGTAYHSRSLYKSSPTLRVFYIIISYPIPPLSQCSPNLLAAHVLGQAALHLATICAYRRWQDIPMQSLV